MARYRVTLALQVTQCIDVEAADPLGAIDVALNEGMDQPNADNAFDASGDEYAIAVYDDATGEEVWTGEAH